MWTEGNNERPRLNHHHASPRCRPARRRRADAGLRARHRPSRCARAGRHRHDGAAPGGSRPRSPPLSTEHSELRPLRHRHCRQHTPALRPLRRQPPLRRQADLRPASGARRRAQRGRLHHSRVGRGARRAVRAGRRRTRAASRAPARPCAGPHTRHAGRRRRDWRAPGRRWRRRGGLVWRARRTAHRLRHHAGALWASRAPVWTASIVSNVIAKLDSGKDALDVLKATFPAGTLSGAPKVRAMEIIEEMEPSRRGAYGGAVGYFSFSGNMDTCITIRTFVVKGDEIFIQAGAGIVADSDPEREYQETVNKVKALVKAVEMVKKGL